MRRGCVSSPSIFRPVSDSDTGVAYSPCVRADVTVTFTLPKAGLLTADGPRAAGDISVADIGIPNEALAAIGLKAQS